jgi:hypothetical protein
MKKQLTEEQQKTLQNMMKYKIPTYCNDCRGFPVYLPFMKCEWCLEKMVRKLSLVEKALEENHEKTIND